MVRITFPPVLQRHLRCPPLELDAPDLRTLLELACARYPGLRGYLLDDAGALRHHITAFVDGAVVTDRVRLAQRLSPGARVDVLQALSGG
jgi:molybdopterin converting factor small subunit